MTSTLSNSANDRFLSGLLTLSMLGLSGDGSAPGVQNQDLAGTTPAGPVAARDNFKARWFNFNVEALQPFFFDADGEGFYTVNSSGARLARFNADPLELEYDVPMGPGLTAIVPHPENSELWCVDSLTSSVGVFDRTSGILTRTIPVGAGPHGLVFSASGDRAYVTCSDSDRVDVISTRTYSVANSIPIPARHPRGIVRLGDTVYVVPLRSGNGSAPRGNPVSGDPNDVVSIERPGSIAAATALPDRDLFAIPISASPSTDQLDPSATRSGIGTILFNLHVRPGTGELWIPHTEALNTERRGEANFIDGQVVRNRIAVVDTVQGSVRTLTLDLLAPTVDERVATPTGIAFSPDGSRAFVCGFGSSRVAVLNIRGNAVSWSGVIHVPHLRTSPAVALTPGHSGAGPRSLGVSPDGSYLLIHNSGENSLTRVDLDQLPGTPAFSYTAPAPVWLGWNPTPLVMVQGRIDFNRTDNSRSRTSSCASCHVDGHLDGLAWDLSRFLDPAGTPSEDLHFPVDDKGPMVTQSVRRLRETGPYHWRGERTKLRQFDGAFMSLLKREIDGVPRGLGANFNYLRRYMEVLALRPNPNQAPDRSMRPEESQGLQLFTSKPVLDGLTCIDCHALPLGTSGAIVENGRAGRAPTTVIPSLRGLSDKLGPATRVGELFGTRSELGAGLGHDGPFADIESFLLQPRPAPHGGQRFDLNRQEANLLASYLTALDSGLAPAAMTQLTVRTPSATPELLALLDQAAMGNCDVVYRRGPIRGSGELRYETGMYDPDLDRFQPASVLESPRTTAELLAQASTLPVTFLGTPLWSGRPVGLDRDLDGLRDLDEMREGTGFENYDTDGDGYPDGYELDWGMDPLVADTSSPDQVPPDWIEPPTVVYTTQNSAKFEFHTSEPTRVTLSIDGGPALERRPLKPRHDDSFSIVMGGLEAGRTYELGLDLKDVSGNGRVRTFPFSTAPAPARKLAFVDEISLAVSPGSPAILQAEVTLVVEGPEPPQLGYNVVAAVYHRSDQGLVEVEGAAQTWLVSPDGVVRFQVPLPPLLPPGELIFAIQRVDAPPGAPAHAIGKDRASEASLDY